MQVKAAIVERAGGEFNLCNAELDAPGAGEILVRVEAVGICHTDIYFRHIEQFPFPAVFGHEGAGIVEQVGAGVTKVSPGDKVLLTFLSCGACRRCVAGRSANCEHLAPLNFTGLRPDGTTPLNRRGSTVAARFFGQSSFSTHAIASERNVVRIPGELACATYAPLGCGVQTGAGAVMRSLDCEAGSSLVVIGGGTVGLSAVMAGRIRECTSIILVEPREERRRLGLEIGATDALDPAEGAVDEQVRAILGGGADYILDTSGATAAIQSAIFALAPAGVMGLLGAPSTADASITIPLALAVTGAITLKGIIEGDSEPDTFIPELISLHRAGRFPFDRLIRHYPFEAINEAIDDQHHGRCVKPVLVLV